MANNALFRHVSGLAPGQQLNLAILSHTMPELTLNPSDFFLRETGVKTCQESTSPRPYTGVE